MLYHGSIPTTNSSSLLLVERIFLQKAAEHSSENLWWVFIYSCVSTSLYDRKNSPQWTIIGSLSNHDGNGSENVNYKASSPHLSLIYSCSISYNLFNVREFFCTWILRTVSKFRKRKSLSCIHSLHKMWNWEVSCWSRTTTAKQCTKKRDHMQACCFANLNLLLFAVSISVAIIVVVA